MAVLVFAFVGTAANVTAHTVGPCNDTNGDGSPSGVEYGIHHISSFAQAGLLGHGGHIPGSHQGFSVCLP